MSTATSKSSISIAKRRLRFSGKVAAVIVFLAPMTILLFLFQYVPIFHMVRNSFFSYTLLNPDSGTFVGFSNFMSLVADPSVRNSFIVTLLFVLGVVILVVPLSFMMAMYLNTKLPARGIVRVLVFIPVVTSIVVVSTIWNFLYHPQEGLINSALSMLGLSRVGFLTDASTALIALVIMTVWQQLGLASILYLSGLQAIPATLYEAAALDGANRFQQHLKLTIPLMTRTTAVVVVFMTIFALQAFAQPFVMTKGGPQESTNLIAYNIYNTAFVYQQPGLASAMTLALVLIAVAVSAIQMRIFRADWNY